MKCTCTADGMSWGCTDACPAVAPNPFCTWNPVPNPVFPNCCPTTQTCGSCDMSKVPSPCTPGWTCNNCDIRCKCQLDSQKKPSWGCVDACPPSQPPVGKQCFKQKNFTGSFPNDCCPDWVCPCDNVKCAGPRKCVVNTDKGTTKCVCDDDACDNTRTPVCGTDGVTYQNICKLKLAACKSGSNVTKKTDGECPPPSGGGVNCQAGTQTADCKTQQICNCINNAITCSPLCPALGGPSGQTCTPVPPKNPNANPATVEDCCPTLDCAPPPLESTGGEGAPPPPYEAAQSEYEYGQGAQTGAFF
jgi:hypothetical protein